MKRALVVIAALVFLFFLVDGLVFGRLLLDGSEKYEHAHAELVKDQERFAPLVAADQRRWEHDPLVARRDGGDAAELLFQHLAFDDAPAPAGGLPASLRARIADAGADWIHGGLEVEAVDTRWMSELARYGYWDIEGPSTPLWNAPFNGLTEPLPSFGDAPMFAKVRLLQGLERGELGPAIDETNELARLCLSSETLIGELVGVSLLGTVRKASLEATRRGLDAGVERVLSEEESKSLRRVLWASGARSSVLGATHPAPVLTCGGLRELTSALYLRPLARHFIPERYRELDAELERAPCRLRRLRAAWASASEGQVDEAQALCSGGAGDPLCGRSTLVLRLPLARAAVGAQLVTLASTDWYRDYRDAGVP